MEHPDCHGCPVARRDFLREAAAGVLATLVGLSATPARVLALPVSETTGSGPRTDRAYPIPAADGVSIDRDESVIIARFTGRVWAFSLACPHQNTALRWDEGRHRFQCPKHKSRYRPDGTFIEGRATRGLDRFAIRRDAGQVLVNLDTLYREDEQPAQWAAAFVQL